MEHNDPSQQQSRQYLSNPYEAQRTQRPTGQLPEQYNAQASNERLPHPSFLQQSPTATSPAGRPSSNEQQMYGFQHGAQYAAMQQTSAMAFAQNNQAQEQQRQPQQPSYQSYGGNMYGMAQPQPPQQPTGSVYDQVPHYRHRPIISSETYSTQFGVPQPAHPFYLAGQAGPTSAPAPSAVAQSIQYQATVYPQPGQALQQPYPSAMLDPSQPSTYATYSQQTQQTQAPQQQQYAVQPPEQSADEAFVAYNSNIRSIFGQVREGTLRDVGQQLLQISQYLLGNVETLGLTRDDEALHDDRIRLWDEFNRAWLTTLQRQFDMTQDSIQAGQPLREPHSIMTPQTLEQLSRELVRLCDSIEKHGLVDYQMGVAEEEIVELIIRCLALLDSPSGRTGVETQEDSSMAPPRRPR
ncbi:hypothetical protein LTR17_014837 [Elasticomyces elasticus]|nr:hypothetical protein LTR17_014837 [Elasticomyces elasticus]